jgi:ATP-dependent DNA ligase
MERRSSGCWVKLRFNCRQEFVIGGYTPSDLGLDALLVGIYRGKDLRSPVRCEEDFLRHFAAKFTQAKAPAHGDVPIRQPTR